MINGIYAAYIKDTHGNVSGKINADGALLTEYKYDSFGNLYTDDTPDPFGYCGEYIDNESGLIYLRNRYYDSNDGRFITEDPAKDGLNWYAYCANEPVMLVDPSGLIRNGYTALRQLATDQYDAKVDWDSANQQANVWFENGISYGFTADDSDDDGAFLSDDGYMYVKEKTFRGKLNIYSNDRMYNYELKTDVVANVFKIKDGYSTYYQREISVNGRVKVKDKSRTSILVDIKNIDTVEQHDIDVMNGYNRADWLGQMGDINPNKYVQFATSIVSNFGNLTSDTLSYYDIRVNINDRYYYFGYANGNYLGTIGKTELFLREI